ncbi:hypothetical protein VNO77_44233 [Canavalia gladiata]|uniref:Uncharacterized protein n=1 Tax=Canavalia gladiata TaxID=3824 RepID=A0AAN9PNL7_CANGL
MDYMFANFIKTPNPYSYADSKSSFDMTSESLRYSFFLIIKQYWIIEISKVSVEMRCTNQRTLENPDEAGISSDGNEQWQQRMMRLASFL